MFRYRQVLSHLSCTLNTRPRTTKRPWFIVTASHLHVILCVSIWIQALTTSFSNTCILQIYIYFALKRKFPFTEKIKSDLTPVQPPHPHTEDAELSNMKSWTAGLAAWTLSPLFSLFSAQGYHDGSKRCNWDSSDSCRWGERLGVAAGPIHYNDRLPVAAGQSRLFAQSGITCGNCWWTHSVSNSNLFR